MSWKCLKITVMKSSWFELYKADKYRNKSMIYFLYHLRRAKGSNNCLSRLISKIILRAYRHFYGLEIYCETQIGKGFYIGHPYGITINPDAIIGENCNVHKGVVIGRENRGKRKGAPVIGNRVWIGINSAIVGNIKIGDDVLIAPCSYVNCNVPSHSIVFGNPCIIKHRDNATEGYINKIL